MKKITAGLLALIILLTFVFASWNVVKVNPPLSPPPGPTAAPPAQSATEFRGVWVASVSNLDFPSKTGLSADALRKEILSILDGAKDIGFTAVLLQVRPTADALYVSEIFPWSKVLTGTQGVAPGGNFDPLAFWVEEAHKRGLELHAWINPYRITQGTSASPNQDVSKLSASHPARLHPEWTVKHSDGGLYFNPGLPAVRELVVNGVTEIVSNYAVDGVHYDDYFYPGTDFADDAAYQAYGSGYTGKAAWRRANIDALIQETQTAVKSARADCRFGVSPAGVWANKENNALGSDTRGYESYSQQYADTRGWVLSEWLDYICPQIYWHIGNAAADYKTLLYWWADVVKDTNVDLYIGQASYRAGTGTKAGDAWYGADEIINQLKLNQQVPQVKGSVHFRYQFFKTNASLYAAVKNQYNSGITGIETDITMPVSGQSMLTVGRPSANVSASSTKYYLLGASDPSTPLYLNGKEVTTRTPEGYFGLYLDIAKGANVFTFTQEGQAEVKRVITRSTSSGLSPGNDSNTTTETPAKIASSGNKTILAASTPKFAEVTSDNAYLFPKSTTTGGPCGELIKGQKGAVKAVSDNGNWVQLESGWWINTSDVKLSNDASIALNTISQAEITANTKWESLYLTGTFPSMTKAEYDGSKLVFQVYNASQPPNVTLPDDSPFASVNTAYSGNTATFTFTLKEGSRCDGYYLERDGNTLIFRMKKPLRAAAGSQPLSGITILIDPGHGGSDSGAMGPLGMGLPEKTLNFYTAQKAAVQLTALGANVQLTRTSDTYLTLEERVEKNRALRPDLFLSIHGNSLDTNVDAGNVSGVSTWYNQTTSSAFSSMLYNTLWSNLGRNKMGTNKTNFYVCRPFWTPSVLLEVGFMCNPTEFAWMADNAQQNDLAKVIAQGVVNYFSN